MYGTAIDRMFSLKRHAVIENVDQNKAVFLLGMESALDLVQDERNFSAGVVPVFTIAHLIEGNLRFMGIKVRLSEEIPTDAVKLMIELYG